MYNARLNKCRVKPCQVKSRHVKVKSSHIKSSQAMSSPCQSMSSQVKPMSGILWWRHYQALYNAFISIVDWFQSVCFCLSSPVNYNPIGHVITGDLAIVTNDKLRNTLCKGPKYRDPQHINWNQNLKLLMDSVEDYARKWAKQEEVELDTLSQVTHSEKNI